MPAKILWVVNYDDVHEFADQAEAVGATGVAVRSDNDLGRAIDVFHDRGMQVFGWRWPSAKRDPAMREAEKVASAFVAGLDGYYVDPEGAPGRPYDWDQPGLEGLADDFCRLVVDAAAGRVFGMTSHYRADAVFADLPWPVFFRHADVLLPQAYWRVEGGVVGHGIPEDNYRKSLAFWAAAGADPALLVPMAGELAFARPREIAAYAEVAVAEGIDELHFYTYLDSVTEAVWTAVRDA